MDGQAEFTLQPAKVYLHPVELAVLEVQRTQRPAITQRPLPAARCQPTSHQTAVRACVRALLSTYYS